MGRNKYPEQTLEKILSTSSQLFIEKGYEQTSIQDIMEALHISKGGIYHHFKSKEEILGAVLERRSQSVYEFLSDLMQNTTAQNAKEKLKKILLHIATDTETHALDLVLGLQIKNPHFVVSGIQSCVNLDAPIISKLVAAGVEDGSIHTDDPELCTEVFLLLLNYWTNPILFVRDSSQTQKRLNYLSSIMCKLGLDIIDDEYIAIVMNAYDKMSSFRG